MRKLKKIKNAFSKKSPITLLQLIRQGVVTFLGARTRDSAICELVEALDNAGQLANKEEFHEAIMKREQVLSTGIGLKVAIPHAKLSSYDHFFIGIGIQKNHMGIKWDAVDGIAVEMIYMIGGPNNAHIHYLTILSELTTILKTPTFQNQLLKATSHEQVNQIFAHATNL